MGRRSVGVASVLTCDLDALQAGNTHTDTDTDTDTDTQTHTDTDTDTHRHRHRHTEAYSAMSHPTV